MQRTQNYNLCQWAAEDRILRSDFNADNQKIDAALKANADAMPHIVIGSYTGNGKYGSSNKNSLTFSFEPKIIFMHVYNTRDYNCVPMCYIWVNGATSCASHFSGYDNTVSWSGHTVSWYSNNAEQQFNENNKIYHYLVIG